MVSCLSCSSASLQMGSRLGSVGFSSFGIKRPYRQEAARAHGTLQGPDEYPYGMMI